MEIIETRDFNSNFEQKLIPQINERIDNGESRVEYTENEIKQILEVGYTTENLYQRSRTKLFDTEIGISIKRIPKNNKFIFFRKVEGVKKESDMFKINFEQKLISQINERIDNGESKVLFSKDDIEKMLDVKYDMNNMYIKLRDILLDTNMGISIKKNYNAFIFFRKVEGVKRESDLINMNFEHKIKPGLIKYLSENHEIILEEDFVKNRLDVNDYNTDNLYQRLRGMLSGTGIYISILKNVESGGKLTNLFTFYDDESGKEKQLKKELKKEEKHELERRNREHNLKIEEEIKDYQKERKRILDEELKEEIRRSEEVDEELLKMFPPPNFESIKYDVSIEECPKCGALIEYEAEKCHDCNTKFSEIGLSWDF